MMAERAHEDDGMSAVRARDGLLASLGESRAGRYWQTLRAFIVARLSKRELDAFLREALNADQLRLHNALIGAIIGNAARTLPSVRERAQACGARVPLGLWGSDRPAVPLVLLQPRPAREVPLAMPRVFPNRLKVRAAAAAAASRLPRGQPSAHSQALFRPRARQPGASVRALAHGRGRVRSCAFGHPPSTVQVLALRRRVLTALPNEPGAPREISEEGLQMLSLAVQCHLRALLSAVILTRQAAEQASGRLAGMSASGRAMVRQGAGGQRLVRRIALDDVYGSLAPSRRASTAAAWQLPLCRAAPPLRWAAANLEALSSAGGPHAAMAPSRTPPRWHAGAQGRGASDLSSSLSVFDCDPGGCELEWDPF